MQKILKKFMKEHFENKENVLNLTLMKYINEKSLNHRSELRTMIKLLQQFFSENFTDGQLEKGKKILDYHGKKIRQHDYSQIMFLTGASLICAFFGIFFLALPPRKHDDTYKIYSAITNTMAILRMTMTLTYIVVATGFCV